MYGGRGGGRGRGGGGGGGRAWMKHLPPHAREKVMRQMEMTPEEREAARAEKIERKRLEKLYDPHPASLSLPAEVARELQEAMHGLDRRGRNLDFYNPDVALEGGASGEDVSQPTSTSEELLQALEAKGADPRYVSMQEYRQRLPAWNLREAIVDAVHRHQVVVISGETGCGKTTQVPQFILDDAIRNGKGGHVNMVCTQPRRISAIGVAERVASEKAEECGGSVGYQIRLERRTSDRTRLLFCTTGILLRKMQLNPTLQGVSHVILDEVHERSIESDFLLIILRDLLPQRPDLKVILMSATMNSGMFSAYFPPPCPIVEIPGFTFPVTQCFLEDAIEATGVDLRETNLNNAQGGRGPRHTPGERRRRAKQRRFEEGYDGRLQETLAAHAASGTVGQYSDLTLQSVAAFDEDEIPLEVIEELVVMIDKEEGEGAVLIFVPGWEEISTLHKSLSAMPQAEGWKIYPLHSQLPMEQQREIFRRPPPGLRKIVIATNIAESSITIDDVVFVIDSGKHKEKTYDADKKLCMLLPSWVSKASATQRKGRAGRVQAGKCWHLFPRHKLDELQAFQLPEIVRTPLESLCLQVRALRVARPGQGGIAEFLHKACTPPSDTALHNALELLLHIGAIMPDEHLTSLGKHLATLPIEPTIGKALIYAALLRCLDPVLSIVSLLSFKSPFVLPLDKKDEANRAKQRLADDSASDHMALLAAYDGWREAQRSNRERDFCWRHFLSASTLRMVHQMRKQFMTLLQDAGLVVEGEDYDVHSRRWPVVKAALLAGLYPKVVRVDHRRKRCTFYTNSDGDLKIHPGSVNANHNHFMHRWLMYFEKTQTLGGLWVYDTTEVSPLSMLLIGAGMPEDNGRLRRSERNGQAVLGVEDWIYFHVPSPQDGQLIEGLRHDLTYLLACKLEAGRAGASGMPQGSDRLVEAVCHALVLTDEEDERLPGTQQYQGDDDDDEEEDMDRGYGGRGDGHRDGHRQGGREGAGGYGGRSSGDYRGDRRSDQPPPPPHSSYGGGGGGYGGGSRQGYGGRDERFGGGYGGGGGGRGGGGGYGRRR